MRACAAVHLLEDPLVVSGEPVLGAAWFLQFLCGIGRREAATPPAEGRVVTPVHRMGGMYIGPDVIFAYLHGPHVVFVEVDGCGGGAVGRGSDFNVELGPRVRREAPLDNSLLPGKGGGFGLGQVSGAVA